MNRPIDTAPTQQGTIGRIDHSIDGLAGNIAGHHKHSTA
jgi:hypothetical protein